MLTADVARAQAPAHSSPIQVSVDGSTVWVVNPDNDSIARIDAGTNTLVDEYPVGDSPRTLALGGGGVYVTNQGSQDLTPKPFPESVMRVDPTSGEVVATRSLPSGCAPFGVILGESAAGVEVYVSCERRGEVIVLDEDLSGVLARIPLDWPDPRNMAISADGSRLYVAHFLTRAPGTSAHVSEIDTSTKAVARVLEIPTDQATCETINSGPGVLNLLMGIHLTPPGAPPEVANQLWVGGVNQNNFEKGLFLRDPRFGGHPKPLLCEGGGNDGRPCESDADCPKGACEASFIAVSRNLYKASFHDITRFQISKIDLDTGAVVGKIDVDEANQGTDLAFSSDGTTAYAVDQFFNSLHIFDTRRGQDGDPTTLFASVSELGPGGAKPDEPCTGGSFLTSSELPFIRPPQVEITPIRADPLFVSAAVARTGNDYNVTTGEMEAVPDAIGTTPHGVAVHTSGDRIYVANFLSRNVSVVKADAFFCPDGSPCQSRLDGCRCTPRLLAVVPTINTADQLTPQLLDGKILFHTAARDASVPNGVGLGNAAPRFNLDDPTVLEPVGFVTSTSHDASYVACISCHPDGGMDGRTWDFSQFGASLRNTMDLRGRASLAPGICSEPAGLPCTTDSECAANGVGMCSNEPSVVCELDIQCGRCAALSPTPGAFCIADRECGGVCSNDASIACQVDGNCGGVCREDLETPCSVDADCLFGCKITNHCVLNECETTSCTAAKCRPRDSADIPLNVTSQEKFFNPMLTVHWNGDRDEVEDFEHTFRSLLGAGDCDGAEHLPDKCIGALLMGSNVAKPQLPRPDLADTNRGLSPRLDHVADYVYSLKSFVDNPNLESGPSAEAQAGRDIFNSSLVRCAECHNGPSPENQHFSDKRTLPSHPPGEPGGPVGPNPYLRHNVATFNTFDLTDPFLVADAIGQFQNAVLPIPASRGPLVEYLTPALVDIWNTAPYSHDGSMATLLHTIVPCDRRVDACQSPDAGKNFDDQHGTTSNLTPRQLRQLAAFLRAPHGPVGVAGATKLAAPIERLESVVFVRNGDAGRFSIKAVFRLAPGASFGVAEGALTEALTVSFADVGAEVFESTIPAGQLSSNAQETRFVFRDSSGTVADGIISARLIRLGAPDEWRVVVRGRGDLGLLDKNHITLAIEIGDDAFVKTRTYAGQSDSTGAKFNLVER